MAESTEQYVALFIDWDNLAISTAADLGGATPDLKRIVQKAQQYGKVLIARAYAEWNTMSERLSVYRCGVEPVYAPTFRFEADPVTQAPRGKSLADPVMVADCVDSLHILPQITSYVIVTGDKDLVPVVRLAQLRGRRVIVIGPDYVASVLRDMADEFISYRTLVQGEGEAAATLQPQRPREVSAPPPRRPPLRPPAPVKAPAARPAAVAPARPAAVAEEREAAAEPELPDLPGIFAILVELLNQMAATGRTRVRATNLKDQLLMRVPGFSERRYGFAKFKDLLMAAERGGLIAVTAVGPVHWVSLPAATAEPEAAAAEEAPAPAAAPAPVPVPEVATPEDAELAEQARRRRLAVVRFIDGLRQRSRWLTYTYVLTNVIGFIGRLVPAGEAEAEARSILNYLVAEGALRIDKVPQEVDVGGIKHRVRMCHFVEDHDIVREAREMSLDHLPPDVVAELTPPPPQRPQEEQGVVESRAEVEERPTPAGEPSLELGEVGAPVAAEAGNQSGNGRVPATDEEQVPSEEEQAPSEEKSASTRSRRGRRRSRAARLAAQAAEEAGVAESGQAGASAEPAGAEAASAEEPAVAGPEAHEPEAAPVADVEAAPEVARPPLDEIFAQVRRILYDLAVQGKARVTGSSLKLRLSRAYPGFEERQYGFAKFKDFLKAAERAGCAVVDVEGQVNWVRSPHLDAAQAAEAAPAEARLEAPAAPSGGSAEAASGAAEASPAAEAAAEDRPEEPCTQGETEAQAAATAASAAESDAAVEPPQGEAPAEEQTTVPAGGEEAAVRGGSGGE